ncbi:MAG: 50S ribosomal protein L9 [candidate division TM6 bacterium GW2011_GWF2_28_16]|jgi:large subunit ribosomal protein L9|nr:MAG: 50S ribosomal protein L9 [candidate division TM6 bacterium GW2011_GWF2_28_16]
MNIYLLKDVEKVGMAGNIVKVSDGFAQNFLIPRKLGVAVTEQNKSFYENKITKVKVQEKIINSKIEMLAERINNLHLTIKEKVHDDGKLYGSVGPEEIIALLKEKDITVTKKQIEFVKTVKAVGDHKVIIKLSSKLKPELTLKVVAE